MWIEKNRLDEMGNQVDMIERARICTAVVCVDKPSETIRDDARLAEIVLVIRHALRRRRVLKLHAISSTMVTISRSCLPQEHLQTPGDRMLPAQAFANAYHRSSSRFTRVANRTKRNNAPS